MIIDKNKKKVKNNEKETYLNDDSRPRCAQWGIMFAEMAVDTVLILPKTGIVKAKGVGFGSGVQETTTRRCCVVTVLLTLYKEALAYSLHSIAYLPMFGGSFVIFLNWRYHDTHI